MRLGAAIAAVGATLALAGVAVAQTPVVLWQRPVELPSVEREMPADGSAFGVLRIEARPDGGVVIAAVEGRRGRVNSLEALHIVAIDGAGKDLWTRRLAVPGGVNGHARMRAAAIDASEPSRTWIFQAWSTREDIDEGASRLLALNHTGGMVAAVANGPRRFGGPGTVIARMASKLTRLHDGSLLAIGSHSFGPPQWWYARYDKAGKMMWERGSKGFPDFTHDAWPLPDGGASLLLMDAEERRERPALRRISADGRKLEQHDIVGVDDGVGCAKLIGPQTHVRAVEDVDYRANHVRKSEIVWHEIGRGITRRIDTGGLRCSTIERAGSAAVYVSYAAEPNDKRTVIALLPTGGVRWRVELAGSIDIASLADGGALVLREIEDKGKPPRLVLTRYAAP